MLSELMTSKVARLARSKRFTWAVLPKDSDTLPAMASVSYSAKVRTKFFININDGTHFDCLLGEDMIHCLDRAAKEGFWQEVSVSCQLT